MKGGTKGDVQYKLLLLQDGGILTHQSGCSTGHYRLDVYAHIPGSVRRYSAKVAPPVYTNAQTSGTRVVD